jgi:WGR domain
MRLIKQTVLYFKEGNSDKVYEIDLCDVGSEKFVVNFRYGRRGAQLKEGSKTAVPVSLAEAEKVFDAVETEKISKGYTTSETGISAIPKAPAFQLPDQHMVFNTDWAALPKSRNKAILQRLHNAATDKPVSAKTSWKLSRIIWKAGEYKIIEASPYLVSLFNGGNSIQQYSCVWALARCGGTVSIPVLQSLFSSHPSASIKNIAGAGLLSHLNQLEKEKVLLYYINSLPEPMKLAVNNTDTVLLQQVLTERVAQQQYNWLEDLYIVSTCIRWIRPLVKKILQELPLKPNYFKHIRTIFKLAELLDDFEISGLLSYRFEREEEMYSHQLSAASKAVYGNVYLQALDEHVNLSKELQKKTPRIAYSQKTRWYLHRRTSRKLALLGYTGNTDYVKLAVSLLVSYRVQKDFSQFYSTFHYKYIQNSYERVETRFPQNANAVYMHFILSGNHPDLELSNNNKRWRLKSAEKKTNTAKEATQNTGWLLKKIAGIFGKKKETVAPEVSEIQQSTSSENGTPFQHLWNQIPQAYVQLLMEAEMEEIHEFAEGGLTNHPQYNSIKERLDKQACKQLLLSSFAIPAKMGFIISKEKYEASVADEDLVIAMLNSIHKNAEILGKQWAEKNMNTYLQQSNFITGLLFAKQEEVRAWGKSILQQYPPHQTTKQAAAGKAVAMMMMYTEQTNENETIINSAANTLFELFPAELKETSLEVVEDLLQHPAAPVLLFGLRLLKNKQDQLNLNELSDTFILSLLHHHYAPVREAGISFLAAMSTDSLLKRQDMILSSCLSSYENVRSGVPATAERMAKADKTFGDKAAEMLMPYLLRKELHEGLHSSVSNLLCNELSNHLQNANKETALNLLYSNYGAAQNVGVVILEKYTEASQLTILQVIALGGHENLHVRNWCWKFYKQQTPRIKYEKNTAIKLLESKWEDSRQFAMQYFREQFAASDWEPATLITLADSVKPDVEAFGRELITKYFTTEHGVDYLLKLSQHPGEKMQLFATNYLEQFAAGDVEKIKSLEFYFRSVLTRVNKSRIAKNRIYSFLLTEGRKTEEAAKTVSRILSDISAVSAIGDKAKCIEVLLQLKALYEVATPLKINVLQERI